MQRSSFQLVWENQGPVGYKTIRAKSPDFLVVFHEREAQTILFGFSAGKTSAGGLAGRSPPQFRMLRKELAIFLKYASQVSLAVFVTIAKKTLTANPLSLIRFTTLARAA